MPIVLISCVHVVGAAAQSAQVDPIRCWWRTSAGAVAVGQPFSIVLTCAVLETDAVRVVPDEAPLAVGSVQLAPFELIGGSHPADLRRGQRRFFQYEYSVRLIEPTAIDRDVKLPEMVIHYRVESRVQSQSLEGRDRRYLLPPQSVHILSMVPADAADIRDGSDAPFGAIAEMRFRARMLNVAALALAALGVIVLIPAVIRALTRAAPRPAGPRRALADRRVLGGVGAELAAVQREARGGWTPDLVARALTAIRIAAAFALGRRVSQRALSGAPSAAAAAGTPGGDTDRVEARVVIDGRWWPSLPWRRAQRFAVASPVTAADVARELTGLPPAAPEDRRQLLEALQKSLSTLSRALYAKDPGEDADKDEALAGAIAAVQRLRRARAWARATPDGLAVPSVTPAEAQRRV